MKISQCAKERRTTRGAERAEPTRRRAIGPALRHIAQASAPGPHELARLNRPAGATGRRPQPRRFEAGLRCAARRWGAPAARGCDRSWLRCSRETTGLRWEVVRRGFLGACRAEIGQRIRVFQGLASPVSLLLLAGGRTLFFRPEGPWGHCREEKLP